MSTVQSTGVGPSLQNCGALKRVLLSSILRPCSILFSLCLCLPLLAEEPKPTVEALQAELALVRAQYTQCSQEMQIWQQIPVMEVRLNLAREMAKAKEREESARKVPKKSVE